jgi:DNA-binding CsgD family transcriptional regulator
MTHAIWHVWRTLRLPTLLPISDRMEDPAKILVGLDQVALALAVMGDQRQVVSLVAAQIRDLLHANAVAIFAWDELAGGLVVVHSMPAGTPGRAVARGVGAVGAAFDQRRPVVANGQLDPFDTTYWDPALELHALAVVPLMVAGEAVGTVLAGRDEPYPFGGAQVNLLAMLGALALAPTLQRARLRSRIQELEVRTTLLQTRSQTRQFTARVNAGQLLEPEDDSRRPGMPRLSRREREVLPLLAQGRTNREIGATLNLSHGTTRNLVARMLLKLGARDRTHAVVIALAGGLLEA